MKLIISKNANINYLAKIVEIKSFSNHPNADALKIAYIGGYGIIVGKDEPVGKYIYFPALSEINPNLLSFANLYRDKLKNANPEAKPGFFENNGRVKAIKLRGIVSEGFLLPVETLQNFVQSTVNQELNLDDVDNLEFDACEHNGKEFWICKKYIVVRNISVRNNTSKHQKGLKRFDRIIDTQFRFHYDTVQVKKEPWCVQPTDLVQLTAKWHGCVDKDTIINTSAGKKTIGDIVDNKLNVQVEAFDITTHQKVFVNIDGYYKIPNDGEWYKITLENGQELIITGNNPVWLPDLNCYRKVENLKIGDSVLLSN